MVGVGIPPPTSSSRGSGRRVGEPSPLQLLRSPPPTSQGQQHHPHHLQQRATIITSNATAPQGATAVYHRRNLEKKVDVNDEKHMNSTSMLLESVVICSNVPSITGPSPTTSTLATAATIGKTNSLTKTINTGHDCDNHNLCQLDNVNNIRNNKDADIGSNDDEEEKKDDEIGFGGSNAANRNNSYSFHSKSNTNLCIKNNYNNDEGNADATDNDEYEESKRATNVKVCIRLRPMLQSDMIDATNNHANLVVRSGAINSITMKRHSSGLITPSSKRTLESKTLTSPTCARRGNAIGEDDSNDEATLTSLLQPAWITHPNDPQRIAQSTNATFTPATTTNTTTSIPTTNNANNSKNSTTTSPPVFTFDRVYGPTEPTVKLYSEHIRSIVKNVVKGYHGSVFAYGQTNSGKTHTMAGSRRKDGGNSGGGGGSDGDKEEEWGVIRLAVRDIFHQIQHTSQHKKSSSAPSSSTSPREYLVRVSYLEIYNEQIYDLLAPSSSSLLQNQHLSPSAASAIRIFESRTEGVVLRGLREEIVTRPEDVYALLDAGDAKRRVGSTALNKTSSRSHSVFRLVLESRESRVASASSSTPSTSSSSSSSIANSDSRSRIDFVDGPVRISSLSLVDLAGSESVKATGSTGLRQKEGQYINKSLSTLGHVVHKLSEMSSRAANVGDGINNSNSNTQDHIPYRDSKLTRLLQPSLGGNAQVCIICNVSPSPKNVEESHNTLKFAMRAKRIVQHARITEVVDKNTLLRSYREEIEELKRQLREARRTAVASQEEAGVQKQPRRQLHKTPTSKVRYSSFNEEKDHDEYDDDDDDDDARVLVSAIANLESLILKAGAKSSSRTAINNSTSKSIGSSIATTTVGESAEESSPSATSRALDAVLLKAASSNISADNVTSDSMSSPGVTSHDGTLNKSCATTPSAITQLNEVGDEGDHDPNLLEELHRIQTMLDTVMMKKKRKGTNNGGAKSTPGERDGSSHDEYRTPKRDAEMERLRMQLMEQEVTSTMRKADSSFLQSQLNEKEGILQEVAVLLEALEKRQLELEDENKQLKNDLAEAVQLVEEVEAARQILEKKLNERVAV